MMNILKFAYSFLSDGLPLVLLFLPIWFLLRQLCLDSRRKSSLADRIDPAREFYLSCFAAFLILLFAQTFVYNSGINEIRLIPFDIIITQIREINDGSRSYRAFIFNVIGNIGIFIPVGMFIAGLFGCGFRQTVLRGFFLSLVIEAVQIPMDRTTDVDDLILNTAGTMIGYGLYRLLVRLTEKCRAAGKRYPEKSALKSKNNY